MVSDLQENKMTKKNKAQDILSMIRARQLKAEETAKVNPQGSPTTEDWKRFKETMVESVDGQPLKKGTGKSNREFFEYLKEDVDVDKCPEGDRLKDAKMIRKFLKNINEDNE